MKADEQPEVVDGRAGGRGNGGPRSGVRMIASALVVLAAGACTTSTGTRPTGSAAAPGSPWAGTLVPVSLPAPVNSLTAVDCASDTACFAVGSTVGLSGAPNGAAVVATNDGGRSWATQTVPPVAGYLSGISCSDARTCVAVGQAGQASNGQGVIIATTDGGHSWQPRTLPAGFFDVTAVACGADRRCIAIGDLAGGAAALYSASPGSAWVQRGELPAGVSGATAVSCPTDAQCWATAGHMPDPAHVAGVVSVTTDGGSSWSPVPTPSGIGYLNGISCSSSGTTASTSTGGDGSAPAQQTGVAGVFCATVGTTASTLDATRSGHGVILTTDNGGGAWSERPVPAASASVMGVSCTGTDSCMTVGSTVAATPQAGVSILTGTATAPWQRPTVLLAPQPLTDVSCVSTTRCVVVGESISEHLAGG